jgi:hypothetical protein
MPAWHHSRYDPWEDDDWYIGLLAFVALAPFFWIILPLVWVLVQIPVAALRSLFSTTRWVEAVSTWPNELKLIWKTEKGRAAAVADHVAAKLAHGYEDLTPPGAEFVYMSEPAGLDDLDR